jgi:ATP-binding cassette subfamily B protein
MGYMAPYRIIIILGILAVILPVAMELLVPRLLQNVIDDGIRQGNMNLILSNSLVMLAAAVIGAAATLGQGVCRARLSQGLAFDIRNDLFSHIQSLPFARLDQLQTGGLMTRLSSDVENVQRFSSGGLALILRALLMIAGSVVMIVSIDTRLSIIILACLVVAGVIIAVFIRVASRCFLAVEQKQ